MTSKERVNEQGSVYLVFRLQWSREHSSLKVHAGFKAVRVQHRPLLTDQQQVLQDSMILIRITEGQLYLTFSKIKNPDRS